MTKSIISTLLLCISFGLEAHNYETETISMIKGKDNQWSLYFSSTFDDYKHRLIDAYPHIAIDNLSSKEFQKLLQQHLKATLILLANSNKTPLLKNETIAINHQTDVRFSITGVPEKLETLDVKLVGIGEGSLHNAIFKTIIAREKSEDFILESENNFELFLNKNGNKFEMATAEKTFNLYWAFVIFGVVVLISMVLIYQMFNPTKSHLKTV